MNYGYYPDSYRGRNIYFLNENYQRLLAGGFEYHYFDCSHEIFVYDRKSKEQVRVVTARSNYLPDKLQPIMVDGDPLPASQEQSNHLVVAGGYDRLVYDRQSKLFFRFHRHPQELKTPEGLLRRRNDSEHSIMILDEQLRVCNEILLPGGNSSLPFLLQPRACCG
jgi:hypothetical protein